MRAGRLRYQVFFKLMDNETDSAGQRSKLLMPVFDTRGEPDLEFTTSDNGNVTEVGSTVKILCRFNEKAFNCDYVTFKNIDYRIDSVKPNIRRTAMTVIASVQP